MKLLCAVLALTLVACGGDDSDENRQQVGSVTNSNSSGSDAFDGLFTGALTIHGPCTDGSTANTTSASHWNVTHTGSTLNLSTDGVCTLITGTISGSSAELAQKQCNSYSASGYTFDYLVTGGTISLGGSTLTAAVRIHATFSGPGGSGTCELAWGGTLSK